MPPATAPSWKIGRNIAMTMPPTMMPRNTMRLDQGGECGNRGVALDVVEVGNLVHHAVDITRGLAGLHHVLHHGREE